jgi:predicted ribosome quality control (RQC) complex YloA/Tae2 family protein
MKNEVKQAVEEGISKKPDYEKYRWFQTSSKKIVIGGKNADQNERIIKELIQSGKNYVVMHTQNPGSPFSIIPSEKPSPNDLEETAIFTASFSKAWKNKEKSIVVDVFRANQISKTKSMKLGTFGVKGKVERKNVELKLYLTKQKGKIRAIPKQTNDAIEIVPGNITKENLAQDLAEKLNVSKDEVLNALPTGNSKIVK